MTNLESRTCENLGDFVRYCHKIQERRRMEAEIVLFFPEISIASLVDRGMTAVDCHSDRPRLQAPDGNSVGVSSNRDRSFR
jgi:hypothetical protein